MPQQSPPSKLAPFSSLREPKLTFSGNVANQLDENPLRGLTRFGPYTQHALAHYTPSVRIAIVGPASAHAARRNLLNGLLASHDASDRPGYLPKYPGFKRLFGIGLLPADARCNVTWPESLSSLPGDANSPTSQVRNALASAVRQLSSVRELFDVAVVHLPDAWEAGLRADNFDAHHELKAMGADAGIPTQVLNDRTFDFEHSASRAWRLAIALYVKAGGVPWKLGPLPGVPTTSAYIGLAYSLRIESGDARFITCCSQVFDSDGGGMQFVAYDARDPIDDPEEARRNPYLSRDDMHAVIARSLLVYQRRNGGNLPRRVVIHKTTAFTSDEVSGCADALAAVAEFECLEITTNVAWRGVWRCAAKEEGRLTEPDSWPVPRGTMVPLTGVSALLWIAGNAPSVSGRGNFYQGGKSIPTPILLTRHAGSGPLELAGSEALALSKMDWNNDALYDPVPVTIRYSQVLARTIASVPTLARCEYPYRLFM